jgi:hypothetical protein
MKTSTSWTLAGGLALLLVLAAAYAWGRDARTRMEAADARATDDEVRAFCRDAGLAAESEAFARCQNGLQQMKLRDRARWQADAAGIL